MKVLIIANACQWVSWPEKIAAIKAFYGPLVELDIDIIYTDFTDIPLTSYPGTVTQFTPTGAVDVAGNDLEISLDWFGENIAPLIAGYDIAVFQTANVTANGLPLGIKFEELNGTWCCETFATDENFTYTLPTLPGQTTGVTLGNEAEIIIEHEIAHALYSISGQTDNTHEFFYANQFSRVLTDIKLPNQSALVKLYQELIALLIKERDDLKSQKSSADMDNTTTQLAKEASTTFPPMIEKWITAISMGEGALPAHHNPGNLKYSTLTASWGGSRGPAASDGGYLCQFATENAGEVALGNFLTLGAADELIAFHAPGARTLRGFTVIYAGNPPEGYIDGIIADMGVPGDTQISTFLS
jgi:hypothetical protein